MYEDRIYQLELKVNILNKQVKQLMECLPKLIGIRPCELGDLIGVTYRQSLDKEQGIFKKDSYRYVGNVMNIIM